MGEAGGLLVGEGKAAEITYARFFDISILRDGDRRAGSSGADQHRILSVSGS